MRRLALTAIGVCLAGSIGVAQDPVKVSPKNYHVVVDNARSVASPLASAAGAFIRRARPAGRPATPDDDPELEAPCESSSHELATRGLCS